MVDHIFSSAGYLDMMGGIESFDLFIRDGSWMFRSSMIEGLMGPELSDILDRITYHRRIVPGLAMMASIGKIIYTPTSLNNRLVALEGTLQHTSDQGGMYYDKNVGIKFGISNNMMRALGAFQISLRIPRRISISVYDISNAIDGSLYMYDMEEEKDEPLNIAFS